MHRLFALLELSDQFVDALDGQWIEAHIRPMKGQLLLR
jgi:hypothetical protein